MNKIPANGADPAICCAFSLSIGKDAMTQSTSSRWKLSSLRKLLPLLSEICLGLLVLHYVHAWIAAFGMGVAAQATALGCLGLGVWCATRWVASLAGKIPRWGSWVLLIAIAGILPMCVGVSGLAMRWIPENWLSHSIGQSLALLPSGLLMISLPTFMFMIGNSTSPVEKHRGWGIPIGLFLGWLWILPACGPLGTLAIAAGVLCLCAWFEFRSESATTPNRTESVSSEASPNSQLLTFVVPFGLGFLWPAVSQIVAAWTLPSVWVLDARITAVAIGFLLVMNWNRSFGWFKNRSLELSLFFLTIATASLTGGQEHWIEFALSIHTSIAQPWLLELSRFLFVGLFPLVFGVTCGAWRKSQSSPGSFSVGLWTSVVGWCFSVFCLSLGIAPQWLVSSGIVLLSTSAMISLVVGSTGVSRWKGTAAFGTLTMVACFAAAHYNSILPARLMYSGLASSQYRSGTDWDLLPYLDEGRPVSVTHTALGTWVGVDYRGLETFFHLNGVPSGYVSHDSRVMPDSPVDLMTTTLPIVMHKSPESVCFLGWGTGVPVATALDFPLQQIDCFERDKESPRLTFSPESIERYGLNPFQDDRVKISSIPPEVAVRAISKQYDVMISNPVRSEEMLSVVEFTREYYNACSKRLKLDGLFCQRFQHLDHGPDALLDVIRTLKAEFPFVAMVDTSPGETLFLASRSRDLETTEFLVERLQRTHVRRILARCGWDWAHVLKLPAVSSSSLDRLLADSGGLPNSVLNHSIAVTHPPDAMRWSNKWNEKIETFSPVKVRFVDLAGESGKQADVTRRMEEINSQRFAMTKVVDKPWAYRTSIKELLQTKPRATLVQTKGEKPHNEMHPVDQRRVDYLKALSRAYRDEAPAADKVHDLTTFIEPYDPLISYFLHYEAAELYSRNPELDPRAEYLHLLNTVYFADYQDRSVHNVIRAIQLVHEHPEIVDSDRARFDQLNGLLQTLMKRWHLRQGQTPDSTDAGLSDLRDSIDVAEAGMDDLGSLAEASGYGGEAWSKRERILEQMLVRPLRGYRGKLLPYHEKKIRQQEEAGEQTSNQSGGLDPLSAIEKPVN